MQSPFIEDDDLPAFRHVKAETGYEPDGKWGPWWVEIKYGHNLRDLRSALLSLSYALGSARNDGSKAICVLVGSRITQERLEHEVRMFRGIARPDIAERVQVVRYETGGRLGPIHEHPGPGFERYLGTLIRHEMRSSTAPGTAQHAVFAELLRNWLSLAPPLTTKALQDATSTSYPTVAEVLKQLEGQGLLERTSDRRVSLISFPWEEWRRWVVSSGDARRGARYVDRTGKGRSPQEMVERLARMPRQNIAVAGVLGAKHHFPPLDISGAVRLDLSLPPGPPQEHERIVRQLDAGLTFSADPKEKAALVLHVAHPSAQRAFTEDEGVVWADPLECLLDLYEIRLDAQADEMLNSLIHRRKQMAKDRSWR